MDTIVRAITVIFGVDMKVDEIEMFQNYKKNNDREYQLSDLTLLGSALRLEMSSECQPPRKLFAKTEVYITDCKPVSQKEAVSSPTMPPKKGIWTTVLWILLFIAAIIAVAFFGFALLAIAVFFIPLLKGKFK